LVQALTYGAQVFAVQGSYDDAFEPCLQACQHLNWYNRKDVVSAIRKISPDIAEGIDVTASFELELPISVSMLPCNSSDILSVVAVVSGEVIHAHATPSHTCSRGGPSCCASPAPAEAFRASQAIPKMLEVSLSY